MKASEKPINETTQKKRLHVGGISDELAADISDLEQRFGKIGKIVKKFEIHQKPVSNYKFGYVTMELSDSQFKQLKKLWNDVRFKGSKLSIGIAKEDYMKRWEKDFRRQDCNISSRKRRAKVAESRKNRIAQRNENPFELSLVSNGRLRTTPRKTDLKNLTIRVSINGKLKIIKCKKTKLWGINKNKSIRDLTSRFIAGEWRDGNDHVIDRLNGKVVIFNDGKISVQNDRKIAVDDLQEELEEEQHKNNKLLEDMLNKYNFDKPAEFEEDIKDEDSSDFDYELEHRMAESNYANEGDDNADDEKLDLTYNVPMKECLKPSQESLVQEYISYGGQYRKELNEKDEEDDDEFFNNLKPSLKEESDIEEGQIEEDKDEKFIPSFGGQPSADALQPKDDSDDNDGEFIPTFGASSNESTIKENNTNTTERLRELLSAGASSTDKLESEVAAADKVDILPPTLKKKQNVGLFFSHFDSPFLVAQAQINKLRELNVNEELNYDEWFWSNRGELNREFRRLRRDVLRRNKKKAKTSTFI